MLKVNYGGSRRPCLAECAPYACYSIGQSSSTNNFIRRSQISTGMRVLLVNVSPLRSGVGNYINLVLNYSKFYFDIINIGLFSNLIADNYPRSRNGLTINISLSRSAASGFLKFYTGISKSKITDSVIALHSTRKYDVVWLGAQDLIFLSSTIKMITGLQLIATVHDRGIFKNRLNPFRIFLNSNFKHINDLDFLFFNSKKTQSDLMHSFNIRVKNALVEHTVDQTIFYPLDRQSARRKLGLPTDKKLVLSVGSDGWVKNLSTLLKAFALINDDSVSLVRVGRMNNSSNVFNNLPPNVKKRIVIREDVSDEYLPLYYSAADLFTFPSVDEGFGLELLEAAFCNIPIVTTNRDPMKDILEGNGYFVDNPLDENELALKITTALTQDNSNIVRKYDMLRKRFSVDDFIRKFEEGVRSVA